MCTRTHVQVKIDSQNSAGNTALHEACERGFSKTIGALISSKATASIRNNLGETALHVAARCRYCRLSTLVAVYKCGRKKNPMKISRQLGNLNHNTFIVPCPSHLCLSVWFKQFYTAHTHTNARAWTYTHTFDLYCVLSYLKLAIIFVELSGPFSRKQWRFSWITSSSLTPGSRSTSKTTSGTTRCTSPPSLPDRKWCGSSAACLLRWVALGKTLASERLTMCDIKELIN